MESEYESSARYRPTLSQEWIKRIEAVFGKPIRYSKDCEALRQDLIDRKNIYIGDTTVKRMFGFAGDAGKIRRSTYDQLAVYVGFKDLNDLEKNGNAYTKQIEMAELYNTGAEAYRCGDFTKAVECWSVAAENDYPAAMVWLGVCYMNGKGVIRDHERGLELYTKVADMGYTDIMFKIAREYYFGDHLDIDYEKAFKWLNRCINQPEDDSFATQFFEIGDSTPEYLLGNCYELGRGTDPDLRMALNYYHLAYDKGELAGLAAIRRNMPKVGSLYHNYNQATKKKWFAKVSQKDDNGMPVLDSFYLDFLRQAPEKYISVEFDPQGPRGPFRDFYCSYERWEDAGYALRRAILQLIIGNPYQSPSEQHIQIWSEIFADGNMNLKILEKFVNEIDDKQWEAWFKHNSFYLKINPTLTPASRRMDAVITHLSADVHIVQNIPSEASLALMKFHGVAP